MYHTHETTAQLVRRKSIILELTRFHPLEPCTIYTYIANFRVLGKCWYLSQIWMYHTHETTAQLVRRKSIILELTRFQPLEPCTIYTYIANFRVLGKCWYLSQIWM